MRDVTGYDAWYNETIRCLTSDDGNRIAIKHSGGWFLALALPGSRRGSVVGNPYSLRGLHDKVEIADASAIAYVQDGPACKLQAPTGWPGLLRIDPCSAMGALCDPHTN